MENNLKEPYELFGIECGEGWKSLYQPILDWIENYNKEHLDNPIEIYQVKEKFGVLTIYCSYYTDELRDMINDAMDKSYHICEICGKEIEKPIVENHWIYPQCKDCHSRKNNETNV